LVGVRRDKEDIREIAREMESEKKSEGGIREGIEKAANIK
jgi:hypothetical protein